uniref:Uncharacterized protein n=1 Tax=Arion vulgaris TaxID=1028688 RepID=A0A0B7A6K1_9EUPU
MLIYHAQLTVRESRDRVYRTHLSVQESRDSLVVNAFAMSTCGIKDQTPVGFFLVLRLTKPQLGVRETLRSKDGWITHHILLIKEKYEPCVASHSLIYHIV